ncbi:MAG: SsrA-binding protein SmpB [Elusimicrobia bacterium]|nr:SsrA-binding protein SmpB [Elusimicrobiota bacterium]
MRPFQRKGRRAGATPEPLGPPICYFNEFLLVKARKDAKENAEGRLIVASNRKARFHYEILETLEAGLSLLGPEVKSLRGGKAVLEGSFARIEGSELFLYNLHIAPYAFTQIEPPDPKRTRKLLLRRPELNRLAGRMQGKAFALVPLELYFKRGWAKIELALAKGKRGPDRRDSIRKKDEAREMERSFKGRFKL